MMNFTGDTLMSLVDLLMSVVEFVDVSGGLY